jgi:hypothetical protein
MMNLYYRCYVIHEDIPSICYTIVGRRPHRSELNQSSSLMEAMHWVDQEVANQAAAEWVERDSTRQRHTGHSRLSQPAML